MQIPSLSQAETILLEGQARNPGPWVEHSRNVALAARTIAEQVQGMDPERVYILGLLHDIGRSFGVTDMLHILHGYHWLMERGYEISARISLTHSFPLQDVRTMTYNWDGTPEEMDFIGRCLNQFEYTDDDRIIQLGDALALPQGICLMEKRMVDVALRRGINEYTLPKWKAFFAIQQNFEARIGRSIYQILPGIIETTFGDNAR